MQNNEFKEKLTQSQFNTNVAFYVHLKQWDEKARSELKRRIKEVFFFSKGIQWKFDSFGIEKAGTRKDEILGYFIFRTADAQKLKKLFLQEFKDYDNAYKISCSIAVYEKKEEEFFELEV